MKKMIKTAALVLCVAMLPVFCASCKDTKYGNYDSSKERYDYYLPDYVKVCKYTDIEVPDIITTPDKEDIDNQRMQSIVYYAPRTQNPDRGAIKGDVVGITSTCIFTDTKKPYYTLTFSEKIESTGQSFCLGTNYFYAPGLDEAVIGMKAGEEKTVKFNLPDPYYKDIMNSGREVEMKIHLIYIDEVDYSVADVKENSVVDGNDFYNEYFGYTKSQYDTSLTSKYVASLKEMIDGYEIKVAWNYIVDHSKLLKLPEKEYNEYYNDTVDKDRKSAEGNGKSLKEYVKDAYGYEKLDDYYADVKKDAEETCFEEMILYYIIRCEKLTLPDESYQKQLKEFGKTYQLDDINEIERLCEESFGLEKTKEEFLLNYTQEWVGEHTKKREDIHTINSKELNK